MAPAFGANNHKITHMGKNKPDCTMLKWALNYLLWLREERFKLAVSNSEMLAEGRAMLKSKWIVRNC